MAISLLQIGGSCKTPDMLEFMCTKIEPCSQFIGNYYVNHVLTCQSYPSRTIRNGRIV
jgi:hypothetical protein